MPPPSPTCPSAMRRRPSPRQGGGFSTTANKALYAPHARAGATALVIPEYGNAMRRIIDEERRQVYELQHTQTAHSEEG